MTWHKNVYAISQVTTSLSFYHVTNPMLVSGNNKDKDKYHQSSHLTKGLDMCMKSEKEETLRRLPLKQPEIQR